MKNAVVGKYEGGDQSECIGVDGRILKWIFRKQGSWNVRNGFIWLRTATGGELLWARQCTFGFHKSTDFLTG
jgi:hypothetical protein